MTHSYVTQKDQFLLTSLPFNKRTMATKFFIVYIKSVASSNYKYDINTMSNIFVQELYACYFTVNLYIVRHLGSYSRKIIFWVT
jgi:hypothetical protein